MDKKFRMLSGHRQRSRLMLCGVLALLILFNVIFHAFATRFRWYLYTSEQYTHEIGTASETLFSGNEEEVRVIFCMPEEELLGDSIYSLVLNTFRQLEARHDFLSVEFVNIYLHPSAVKPYRGEDPETGKERYPITEQSVIFVRGQGASEVFRVESLSSFFVLDEEKTITAYNGEEIGLSCIRWVLRDRHPVAAFTSTHGENFGELLAFATTLTASGYDLSVLDLHGEIPEEVELIVIANPRWDFDRRAPGSDIRSELDRLAEFLARGGSLFVSLDPYAKADLEGLRGFLAERGILQVYTFPGPWSWMNRGAVRMIHALVDAIREKYGFTEATPWAVMGGSMGGMGALIYTANNDPAYTPTACLAHCPCVDVLDRVYCKENIPRTFFRAVADYEMPIAEALKTLSPAHRIEDMPFIPYHIINDLADELFPPEQMDAYVAALRERGHNVTYHRLENCRHGELTSEEWEHIRGFLLAHLIY